jgi:DNA-directed RNA polymerase subunit RPC12/RpoP
VSHAARPLHIGRAFAAVAVADPVECPNCGEPECDCSEEDKEIAALADCTGTPSKRTGRNERCAWTTVSDWMGDPSIPNGTCSWSFAKCLACGAEVQQPYPDWLERQLPQKDYA